MYGLTPWQNEIGALRRLTPSMRYDGSGPLSAWQRAARNQLWDLLGLDEFVPCEDRMRIEYRVEKEDRTETRFYFQSEDGYLVPCVFVRPKRSPYAKPPVTIGVQGHSRGMHNTLGIAKYEGEKEAIRQNDKDYAIQCVRRGLCAVTLEQRCFGEKGGTPYPDCYSTAMTAIIAGRTVIGGRVWDIRRLIDVLEKYFSDVCDMNRIYCMGNSGGGTATIYATALEQRIAAAMPSCAFCTYADSIGDKHHCACNYVPRAAKYFDMADLCGLIAPRPLVIVNGRTDDIFPADAAQREFRILRETYYAAAGAPDNAAHIVGEAGHRFYADAAWPVFTALTSAQR